MINFSIEDIKNHIIFGIPLYDAAGNPFPDSLLQSYLDSAIAWAEQTLNIVIQPREEVEFHDYIKNDYLNWGFIKLWRRPVIEVKSLEMYYGDQKMLNIPSNWIKIDNLTGMLQLFPNSGSAGNLIITAGGGLWIPLINGLIGYAPQMWKITYKAGMTEPDPEQPQVYRKTHIHPNLKEVIYKKAAMSIMEVWGDLIIGAGIANQSVGIDGLSQSIGTTQSPMYGGASARIEQLQKDIDSMLPGLRSYYSGIDMTVI